MPETVRSLTYAAGEHIRSPLAGRRRSGGNIEPERVPLVGATSAGTGKRPLSYSCQGVGAVSLEADAGCLLTLSIQQEFIEAA